jgi:hypothetical protein
VTREKGVFAVGMAIDVARRTFLARSPDALSWALILAKEQ